MLLPVASVTDSACATIEAAGANSPAYRCAVERMLKAMGSTISAPASRASADLAVGQHVKAVRSPTRSAPRGRPARASAAPPRRRHPSPRKALTAWRSTGAPVGYPSQISREMPASSRSGPRAGPGGGGAVRAASATSRIPPPRARRPANVAAASASRYVSRASRGSSGSNWRAAFSSSGGASLPRLEANAIWPRSRSARARRS